MPKGMVLHAERYGFALRFFWFCQPVGNQLVGEKKLLRVVSGALFVEREEAVEPLVNHVGDALEVLRVVEEVGLVSVHDDQLPLV